MGLSKINVTTKQIGIGVSVILMVGIIAVIVSYLNFLNSWRYIRYQIVLANEHKNSEVVKYFDFEKLADNHIQREISQAKNLDEALGRPHDDISDMFTYQFYNSNKALIVKNMETTLRQTFENAPDADPSTQESDLKTFWKAFRNQPISRPFFQVKNLSKQKVETTDTDNRNTDDDITIVYERVNKEWRVTDFY